MPVYTGAYNKKKGTFRMKPRTRSTFEFLVLSALLIATGALLGMLTTVLCYEVRAGREYQAVTKVHLEMYKGPGCRGCHE